MADSFKPIWGKSRVKRPGITSASTDTESGEEGAGTERDLYALDVMFKRGLIPKEEYDRRRAELTVE
jgi:hypothetical protein